MPEKRYHWVMFSPYGMGVRLFLTLEGEWVISSGLAPNVNRARVPWPQFDLLGNDAGRTGRVEFFYSSDVGGSPDYAIENVTVVDVETVEVGIPHGQTAYRIIEYRLHLADFRARFVEPRGGRLMRGEINREPRNGVDLLTNGDLISDCAGAMGGVLSLPTSVQAVAPLRNLSWYAAHAPSELGRILQHVGATYCPHSQGVGFIDIPGTGFDPVFPPDRVEVQLTAPAVNRFSQRVVLTSAPVAITDTYTADAGSPPSWHYVAQDDDGKWRRLDLLNILGRNDPVQLVKTDFAAAREQYRERMRSQFFRCLQLDTDQFPPRSFQLLRQVLLGNVEGEDEKVEDIALTTILAMRGADGTWQNSAEPITIHPQLLAGDDNVLSFNERIGRIVAGGSGDADADFDMISATELHLNFSLESADAGTGEKKYFNAGFRHAAGFVSSIGESQAEAAMRNGDPDVIVLSVPQLRLIRLNGNELNRGELEDQALEIARRTVATPAAQQRTVILKGFFGGQVTGRVTEIRFDQANVKTTFVMDDWHTATRAGRDSVSSGGGSYVASTGSSRAGENRDAGCRGCSGPHRAATATPGSLGRRAAGCAAVADAAWCQPTGARRSAYARANCI